MKTINYIQFHFIFVKSCGELQRKKARFYHQTKNKHGRPSSIVTEHFLLLSVKVLLISLNLYEQYYSYIL